MPKTQTAYSFAEPSFQTGTRWHIRAVGKEGPRPNGGIPDDHAALCGLDLRRGWDVKAEISRDTVMRLLARNEQARSVSEQAVCAGCAKAYLEAL
ncbi:hypothetical protein Ade02nite_20770 [Paractinoplanes deccanensis]|uniref:Uncharacterized protein n=1 Tax=Paractinoplanes deccanensis TaxID=113561 RepID=A0ABQ3Y0D0_9ACTN|nr:hypothetical protein [Actinoplanes deccanensis]GID73436.1 hypothetical protein Ade02nite_20770 [Actinoplanes deccanensis]